jgi:hypothetical protein
MASLSVLGHVVVVVTILVATIAGGLVLMCVIPEPTPLRRRGRSSVSDGDVDGTQRS